MKLNNLLKALLVLATAATVGMVHAQSFPTKPLTIIVPFPAGGPSDFVARKLQPEASAKLGQTVVIENIGGGGGSIALSKLLNAAPDGHAMALGSPMELVLAPMTIPGVKYKSEDFKLVARFASTSTILAVRTSLNVKTVDELLAWARKNPSKQLSYGSVGPGSLYHLIGEKFSQLTNVPMLHVPYKGIAPVMADLMGGQIDMAFLPMAGSIPQTVLDGKLQGLAVTSKAPHPLFNQFPAMASMKGLEAMEFDIWSGVQVHKNTPDAVVSTLNKAFYAAAQTPDVSKALESSGNTVLAPRSPAELTLIYQGEIERYRALAKSINLQPQ